LRRKRNPVNQPRRPVLERRSAKEMLRVWVYSSSCRGVSKVCRGRIQIRVARFGKWASRTWKLQSDFCKVAGGSPRVQRTLSIGSELCKRATNFWPAVVWTRGTAHGGKSRSKNKRSRFQNGAKTFRKRRKIGDDPVGKTKVASSDEASSQLYFASSSERVYPKKVTKTLIDWGGAGDGYL